MFDANKVNHRAKSFACFFTVFCFSFLSACVSNPSVKFERKADAYQLHKSTHKGSTFDLVIFENQQANSEALHVYIGGDGQPWLNNIYKSKDPTTRRMTTLELMSLDQSPAIYLGRPCYHTQGKGRGCENKWWTSHRYSKNVVNEMHYVLNHYIADRGIESVTLIGFSGGGTLAMLLAPLIEQTIRIVTISGNLDTEQWLKRHQYTPLLDSQNPVVQAVQISGVDKLHLLGMQDKNIPVDLIIKQFEHQQNTEIIRYPTFTHHCCWQSVWPEILGQR